MEMDELLLFLQRKAPYLLSRILGIDYLQKDFVTVPVLIVSLGDSYGLVPFVEDKLIAIYLPDEDKYVPLSEETIEALTAQQQNTFLPAETPINADNNPNLYNMIRPPSSGRAIYAESEVEVVTEPISDEYFRFGITIIDNRPEELKPKVFINPIQMFTSFTTDPSYGTPRVAFNIEGEPVRVVVFKHILKDRLLVITDNGYCETNTESLPLFLNTNCGCWPHYNEGTEVVYIKGGVYYKPILEEEEEVKLSDHIRSPLVVGGKAVLPKSFKKLLLPEKEIFLTEELVRDFTYLSSVLSNKCHRVSYVGGGEFTLNNERFDKVSFVEKLLKELGLFKEDVLAIIKTAEEQGNVEFLISKMEESLKDTKDLPERKEEIIDAFDSQMRVLLNKLLESKDIQPTLKVVESLRNAFTSLTSPQNF